MIIQRTRTLRPSTRKQDSAYRVKVSPASKGDTLRLTIREEGGDKPILGVFEFNGDEIESRDSIHFSADRAGDGWRIRFHGAKPFAVVL